MSGPIHRATADAKKQKYTGDEKGSKWEVFDRQCHSWMSVKWGVTMANAMWRNECVNLIKLDLKDSKDLYDFQAHSAMVVKAIKKGQGGIKEVETLEKNKADTFESVRWHIDHLQEQYDELFTYLEDVLDGPAKEQLDSLGRSNMSTFRDHLYERYGGGELSEIEDMEQQFRLCCPPKGGGPAIHEKEDLVAKFDVLEGMQRKLREACPQDKLGDYKEGKRAFITRMVLDHIPSNYDACIRDLKTLIRTNKIVAGDANAGKLTLTNIKDKHYDDTWLPEYMQLRTCLINQYNEFKKVWDADKHSHGSKRKRYGDKQVPTMMGQHYQPGNVQPGAHNVKPPTCWGCGEVGHRAGASECKAGKTQFHSSAPDWFKSERQSKGGKGKGGKGKGGKGRGGGRGQAPKGGKGGKGKGRGKGKGNKGICFDFNNGNGYCRYGSNCNFSHDKQSTALMGSTNNGDGSKSNKKKKKKRYTAAMVAQLMETHHQSRVPSEPPSSIDGAADLYKALRGQHLSGMMAIADDKGKEEYVPPYLQSDEEKRDDGDKDEHESNSAPNVRNVIGVIDKNA